MPRAIRKPSHTWVGFSNGQYLAVLEPKYRIRGVWSTVVAVINEDTMTAYAYGVPYGRQVLPEILNQIATQFKLDMTFKDTRDMLRTAQEEGFGQWLSTKALHPLVDKVMKEAWEWFKREALDQGEFPQTIKQIAVKLPAGSVRRHNGVTYEGYTNRLLKTHSFADIRKLTEDAIKLCDEAWRWKPHNLRLMVHSDSRAMGLAYNPGKGVHRVSLHSRLLNEYDTMSVFRVVLHEFCHHYRDERFPVNRYDAHDKIFCQELSKVDPIVAENPKSCTFFTDEVWQDSAVVQAKAEKAAALKQASNYDPDRGYLQLRVLKSGYLRLDWLPNFKGGFTRKAIPVSIDTLRELVDAVGDPSKVKMGASGRSATRHLQSIFGQNLTNANLAGFIKKLDSLYPQRGYGELL